MTPQQLSYLVTDEEEVITPALLRKRLMILFMQHIGRDNAIKIKQIMIKILGSDIEKKLNIYQKVFYWEAIKKILREFRNAGILFTCRVGKSYYVLQTQEEAEEFERITKLHIKRLHTLIDTSREWVRQRKWERLGE